MTEYMYSIIVEGMSEDTTFDALDLPDVVGVGASGGLAFVEFEVSTTMPDAAVDQSLTQLAGAGIVALRIDLDLVNIAAIAERTGRSRQAVRMWIEGERRVGFPAPYSVSTGLRTWLWTDVHSWLRTSAIDIVSEYARQPLPAETIHCSNGHLADPKSPYRSAADMHKVREGLSVGAGFTRTHAWLATTVTSEMPVTSGRSVIVRELVSMRDWTRR